MTRVALSEVRLKVPQRFPFVGTVDGLRAPVTDGCGVALALLPELGVVEVVAGTGLPSPAVWLPLHLVIQMKPAQEPEAVVDIHGGAAPAAPRRTRKPRAI